jgi:hypothetical protein
MTKLELQDDEIAIVWSVEDVMMECDWLTKEQALDVLHKLKSWHNATIGINWNTIRDTGEFLYSQGVEDEHVY